MSTQILDASVCPKCRVERVAGDQECPRCGIVYAKFRSAAPLYAAPLTQQREPSRWIGPARAWLIDSDEADDSITLAGRGLLFVLLAYWSWTFMTAALETNVVGESFMHLINLPFHEAGHLFFMPFGRFMMFLGGSLGQILIPLVCLMTFLMKTRDPFAAAVALWWTGENFLDIAPYINDARTLDLVLLGGVTGKETDGHDWENILSMLGLLTWDHRLAQTASFVGTGLMLSALLWAGYLLRRQLRRLS